MLLRYPTHIFFSLSLILRERGHHELPVFSPLIFLRLLARNRGEPAGLHHPRTGRDVHPGHRLDRRGRQGGGELVEDHVTRSMGSTVSAVLVTAFKVQGMSFSISSACSTGAHCIGTGYEQILLNKADMAFCRAGENVYWDFTSMFDCMGALSTSYNDTPKKASRRSTPSSWGTAPTRTMSVTPSAPRASTRPSTPSS